MSDSTAERIVAYAFSDDQRLVERPTPNAAPTAYRIWQAGVNKSDDGDDIFSERSARALMLQQSMRGNLYSSDFDHLSLLRQRGSATAGRASGWHRLETRLDENGAPELWAVDVDWCQDVKEGLEQTPPLWRYFSPAFDIDPETNEIISYTNTALCINPKTWNNNQLAARMRARQGMLDGGHAALSLMAFSKEEHAKLATLNAMHAVIGGEGSAEHKAAAEAMYNVHGGAEEHAKLSEMAEAEAEAEAASQAEAKAKKDAEEAPEGGDAPVSEKPVEKDEKPGDKPGDKPEADAKEAKTKAKTNAISAEVAEIVAPLTKQLESLIQERRDEKKAQRVARQNAILDSRKDLSAPLRATLRARNLDPDTLQAIVDAHPLPNAVPRAASAATRGEGQGTEAGAGGAPHQLRAQQEVDRALRFQPPPPKQSGFGPVVNGERRFNTMTPKQRRAQARGGGGASIVTGGVQSGGLQNGKV